MSFFDSIKEKYAEHSSKKLDAAETAEFVKRNPIQNDYIIKDGETVSVYADTVTVMDIFTFFKVRMPWAKFQITDDVLGVKDPAELLNMKFVIFNQLAGVLGDISDQYNGRPPVRLTAKQEEPEYAKDGVTLH